MPSERELAANRRNALLSTGPRTPEGKNRSSLNALQHGLRAERAVLHKGEDAAEFEELRDLLLVDLQPASPRQYLLAERVILAAWHLRRSHCAETGLFNNGFRDARRYLGRYRWAPHGALARVFRDNGDDLSLLCRYEARAERAFYRALREYEKCRTNPFPFPDTPAPPPLLPSPTDLRPGSPSTTITPSAGATYDPPGCR